MKKVVRPVIRHFVLFVLALFWMIPIIWLLLNSFSTYPGINIAHFIPEGFTLDNYKLLLFKGDAVAQFPKWFFNTLVISCASCVISSFFVLSVSYAMSCMRFKGRKLLMNISMILNLFPGLLSLIAVYFILKAFNLTDNHIGLILMYSAASGLGYLIAKGFFDTISVSLRESAKLEGASELQIFSKVIIPLSKPIIVYTVISSFLAPWMDFVAARLVLNSGTSDKFTVSIGLYNMLEKNAINTYFARFCAGGILISIPISLLFVIMQKFYIEGITGGAVKG